MNSDKYRVQTRYNNPPAIVERSGRLYRWVDSAAFHTLNQAKAARRADQRIIKICTPSEGALLVDRGAYPGRRFNVIVEPDSGSLAA